MLRLLRRGDVITFLFPATEGYGEIHEGNSWTAIAHG